MQLTSVNTLSSFKPMVQRPLANHSTISLATASTQREGVQVFSEKGSLKPRGISYLRSMFNQALKEMELLENEYGGQFAIVVHQKGQIITNIQLNYFSNWTDQTISSMPRLINTLLNWEEITVNNSAKALKRMDTTLSKAINSLMQAFAVPKKNLVGEVTPRRKH
jgi:hypothetical protein